MKKLLLLLLTPFLFFVPVFAETQIPDRPTNGIYDPQSYLDSSVAEELANFNSKSDVQIGVYIVDTIDGQSIESQANEIARAWKIGYSGSNKGALIAIAINDRKFRIETANELSTILTDSKTRRILDGSKSYMRSSDYSGAVKYMISEIEKTTNISNTSSQEQTDGEIKTTFKESNEIGKPFVILIALTILALPFIALYKLIQFIINYVKERKEEKLKHEKLAKQMERSRYDYNDENGDKLYPNSPHYIANDTWTPERLKQFWYENKLKRSKWDYNGIDKLYPLMAGFVMNDSWTKGRVVEYELKLKREKEQRLEQERIRQEHIQREYEDRLRRSQYNYSHSDKLNPDDDGFVKNATWTASLLAAYEAEQEAAREAARAEQRRHSSNNSWSSGYSSSDYSSSSSSSWSSDSWGGGGFDGGGSSGSW